MPRFATVNNVSSYTRRAGGIGDLLSTATSQLGGIAPYHWWDFIANRALFASADVGAVTSTPGWSYTRADAQSAYAETSAGVLVPFATGVLRRTDKGVLIEGARTNLLTYSQQFDDAAWTKTNITVTANATAAPDGTTTADLITLTGSSAGIRNSASASAAAKTYSFFVKSSGGSRYFQILTDGTVQAFANFDIQTQTTGTLGTSVNSASVTTLGNGWYRLVMTATDASATNSYIALVSGLTAAWSSGASSGAFFVWGAQLEAASFPSSYIPTTTASATRAADVLTVSSPGVTYPLSLFAEFERVLDTGTSEGLVRLDDVTATNSALIFIDTIDRFASSQSTDGASAVTGAVSVATTTKGAARIAANDHRSVRGGTLGPQDTTATNPPSPTRLIFGDASHNVTQQEWGYLRRAAIVNSAVNDAGLQSMTL